MSAPGGHLLVVEDDPVIQGSLSEMLGQWGYSCDTCGDGRATETGRAAQQVRADRTVDSPESGRAPGLSS